jgi:small subunit ribosomal protein S20
MKTNEKARLRNRSVKTGIRGAVKRADASSGEEAEASLRNAASLLDSAARKHVIHKNKAARQKSRLAKKLKSKK